ncbi:16S rRNA m(7)G-527 methyltransferase [Microlunatus sagamiharensis]|uniref:Ribosomal RNA small subunit methyltransferase G n=1 Tax=Microlunatus sagamiharensis TaxID=546874 RepID=A0A1H2N6E7_9ACTN|nr:16S rRNA (guanine(527)-N(7))-methyltransferase RsmG [Microlunatus sagamiharensis]SDV01077.1 16S rRNA m(7)G-527 methyltransferase [Microlunatus sagamiharensis]
MTDVGPEVVEAVFGTDAALAERYVEILATTGVDWGLIGPRETDRLWERHVLNSAAVADLVPGDADVVDVGSGAGLPGLPLALARPDLRVTLLEPLLRRATFLTQTVEDLGLGGRVEVVRGRAEDHRGAYDVVTSRALAPLPRLLEWCLPLTAPGGAVLAVKGRSAAEEVEQESAVLARRRLRVDVLSVQAHATSEPTTVVRVRRA